MSEGENTSSTPKKPKKFATLRKKKAKDEKKDEKKSKDEKKEEKKKKNTLKSSKMLEEAQVREVQLPPIPEPTQLNEMFQQLLDDLEVAPNIRTEMMQNYSAQMKWMYLYQNKIRVDDAKKNIQRSDSDAATIKNTPQYFINKLQTEPDLGLLISLRISLVSGALIWVNKFRDLNGIGHLLILLNQYEKKMRKNEEDHEFLYQCILCFKAIMNNKAGLEEIKNTKDAFNKIVLCLDSPLIRVRIVVYEMLSTLCLVYRDEGHGLSLDAMSYYQFIKREAVRFSHLVESLKFNARSENEKLAGELKLSSLSFINCLISIPEDISTRASLRGEFIRLGLREELQKLNETDPQIQAQIEEFINDLNEDETEFQQRFSVQDRNIKLDDPVDVFKNLNEITSSLSYIRRPFKTIMSNLLFLPADTEKGARCWLFIDKFIQNVVLQSENFVHGEERFRMEEVLNTAEERAELEALKEKYSELEVELQEEKTAHQHTFSEKNQEKKKYEARIEKLREHGNEKQREEIQQLKEKIGKLSSELDALKDESQELKQEITKLNQENEELKQRPPVIIEKGSSEKIESSKENDTNVTAPLDEMTSPPESNGAPPPLPPMGGPPPPPPPPGLGMGGPPPPPPPGGLGAPLPGASLNLPKINVPKPKKPMKNLNWTKIPPIKIKGTIFEDIAQGDIPLDYEKIENLFQKKVVEKKPKEKKPVKKQLSLIDSRRSQNIGIFLSTMKLSAEEIKNAIIHLEEKHINLENTLRLIEVCPKEDEIRSIKTYLETGDPTLLGNVEKFLLEVYTVPALSSRLECVAFTFMFPQKVGEVKPILSNIRAASKEVRKSEKFKRIIQIILRIGNFLNGGTTRGEAYGFKLSTLPKMAETKSVDQKLSLMHHLIFVLRENLADEELTSFYNEMSTVNLAKSVSFENLTTEINDIKKGLKVAESNLKNIPKIEGIEDVFHSRIPDLVKQCRNDFEDLQEFYSEVESEFQKTTELFGENNTVQPSYFFSSIWQFIDLFQKTSKEIDEQRKKEEAAKKKAEAEERKQRIKEQKEKEKEERSKKLEEERNETYNDQGIMDEALTKLKGGQVFAEIKKGRQKKREQEVKALESVMGALSSLTTSKEQEEEEEKKRIEELRRQREERRKQREEELKKADEEAERRRQERRKRLEALKNQE